MTDYRRQAAVLIFALVGAALLLVGLAPQAQSAPGDEEEASDRPPLSAEKAKQLEEAKAKDARKDRGEQQAPEEREIDEDPDGNPYFAGELIVTYEAQATAPKKEATKQKVGARAERKIPKANAEVLAVPEVKNEKSQEVREEALESKKQDLEDDSGVKAVDYNYVRTLQAMPNDKLFKKQWGTQRVRAHEAWDTGAMGTNTIIAIIDDGATSTHPDLNGAFVDQWNYWYGDPNPTAESGHGTHVSGIAAATTNNKKGMAGTAPYASLFDYDVCGGNVGCDDGAIIAAIYDAKDFGADVINMSLGGEGFSWAQLAAVDYAWNNGVVVVAAAGNDATSTPFYPAAHTNAIAVSGTDYYNGGSNFSNYGTWVDVAAPGGETGSPKKQKILSSVGKKKYAYWDGTSMASPFVAGVAALVSSQDRNAADTRAIIEGTATDLGTSGKDVFFGWGLVDAWKATSGAGGAGGAAVAAADAAPDAARSKELNQGSSITPSKKEAVEKK